MSGDDSDNVGPRHKEGIVDLHALDAEIQFFLRDLGKTTMSLPPVIVWCFDLILGATLMTSI
jgi:hypothetical protein